MLPYLNLVSDGLTRGGIMQRTENAGKIAPFSFSNTRAARLYFTP